MKKKYLIIAILSLYCSLLMSCKNKNDTMQSQKQNFENDVKQIIDIIENISVSNPKINTYYFMENSLYEYYPDNTTEYKLIKRIDDNKVKNAMIVQDFNQSIYLTAENDKYCAVKDFNSNSITVYDISNKEKCHLFYVAGNELSSYIIGYYTDDINSIYNSGDISNGNVSLFNVNNILDDVNCEYKWYRNDIAIENSNVNTYVITSDFEDANYYVEITTPDGKKYKSKPFNVKISK